MARLGCQTPTQSVVLPYSETKGQEAIDLYQQTGRTAQEWQQIQVRNILAVNNDGLWVHTKYGYAVSRRNGKSEIAVIRALYGVTCLSEAVLYTSHRTTTSHSAWIRTCRMLSNAGYTEIARKSKKEDPPEKSYRTSKQFGLETIEIFGGGAISFRTRTDSGGLGEGYDLLIIDEAQEYTGAQETALKYVVSDSMNPQTIFCGTPPTVVSSGTVFMKMRDAILEGNSENSGWAEWSVEKQTDPHDREAWYKTNPSMGTILTERKIADEIGPDELDFNVQRLGLWIRYSLKSVVSRSEWEELKADTMPCLSGALHVGVKFGKDGTNVAVSVAVRTEYEKIFVESIDCRPARAGVGWIIDFIEKSDVDQVVIDGANGQQILTDAMKDAKLIKPILPTVKEVIVAYAVFEQMLEAKTICHMNQPSLTQSVSNCEKRPIGSNGGFGYKSIKDTSDIALMDSMILALWSCSESKVRKKQKISY